jgi:ubiquinol-cytochrome c reductase cytochrome c subunit
MALLVVAFAGTAAALLGPSRAASGAPAAAQQDDLLRLGRVTYQERCATCHGGEAEGTDQGPPIAGLGTAAYDFYMATGRMPLTQPGVQPRRRAPVLTAEEIDAVTAYLESLRPGGQPIPEVDPAAGDLSQGQQLYQLNCAPCHGATGQGGAAGIVVAPGLDPATDVQVAEAIRIGPGTMPVFESPTVDQNELNALVRYVAHLRDPEDPGGAGLGGTGPLIEGFVAFFGAVGLLILAVRWIGTRT